MRPWQAIRNGGKFYVQLANDCPLYADQLGRPIHYRSIKGAREAAAKLNLKMRRAAAALIREARLTSRAIDHINGDIEDNRPENLRVVTLRHNR